MIFDNDHNKRNNVKDMIWKYNITENGSKNVSKDYRMGDGDEDEASNLSSKKSNKEISFKTPDNIHIHIYAIDDHLEFKYQSSPKDSVSPKIDIIPSFEVYNETYGNNNNSTSLRFIFSFSRSLPSFPLFRFVSFYQLFRTFNLLWFHSIPTCF